VAHCEDVSAAVASGCWVLTAHMIAVACQLPELLLAPAFQSKGSCLRCNGMSFGAATLLISRNYSVSRC
jgi:hypothetical protein